MARFPRAVIVDVPHHVTQRGNARQVVFSSDSDRTTYLALLREYSELYSVSLLGYCLMSNHLHLIAIPHRLESLAHTLKQAHGRYASYWNVRQASSGHVWQGRFYSCPLDEPHLWEALRYVELNPVRAAMVSAPEQWAWSSAAAHCGLAAPHPLLDMSRWQSRWTAQDWRAFLATPALPQDLSALRRCTHTGRPLGDPDFVTTLERRMQRPLAPRKAGRHKKPLPDPRQLSLSTVA